MTTGRIDYSPDYKSEKRPHQFPVGADGLTDGTRAHLQREAEHARLRDAVVESALRLRRSALALKKFWDEHDENAPHAAMEIYDLSGEDIKAREVFDATASALIDFEASQEKG